MIIIGTTELTLGRRRGEFFCPTCRQQQTYRHRVRRTFLTLYFVPLIPLSKTAEFVLCERCRQAYEPWVVDRSAEEVEETLRKAAREHIYRVMVLTMIADDTISEDEIAAVQRYMNRIGGTAPDNEMVQAEIARAKQVPITAAQYAGHVADELTDREREQMVVGAFLVASASGPLSASQLEDLKLLPLALGMDEDDFRRIIAEASEE